MKIQIGEKYEVWESGVVIGVPGETISFSLDANKADSDGGTVIEFEFELNKHFGEESLKIDAFVKAENVVLVKFSGFAYADGIGNREPLPVGSLNKRKLFLNYRLFYSAKQNTGDFFGKGGVTVIYTWLIAK